MQILNSGAFGWEIERAILRDAADFPRSHEDISCFERRVAATKRTVPRLTFTIKSTSHILLIATHPRHSRLLAACARANAFARKCATLCRENPSCDF